MRASPISTAKVVEPAWAQKSSANDSCIIHLSDMVPISRKLSDTTRQRSFRESSASRRCRNDRTTQRPKHTSPRTLAAKVPAAGARSHPGAATASRQSAATAASHAPVHDFQRTRVFLASSVRSARSGAATPSAMGSAQNVAATVVRSTVKYQVPLVVPWTSGSTDRVRKNADITPNSARSSRWASTSPHAEPTRHAIMSATPTENATGPLSTRGPFGLTNAGTSATASATARASSQSVRSRRLAGTRDGDRIPDSSCARPDAATYGAELRHGMERPSSRS